MVRANRVLGRKSSKRVQGGEASLDFVPSVGTPLVSCRTTITHLLGLPCVDWKETVAVKINPRKLRGQWTEGYALDVQTTSATFLGYNAFGHPEFDTTRSALGELVYQLEYRGSRTGIPEIVDTVAGFLREWKITVDGLVPVPPSNTGRKSQPVAELARAISERTGIAVRGGCVKKVKNTGQLKDVCDERVHRWFQGGLQAELRDSGAPR